MPVVFDEITGEVEPDRMEELPETEPEGRELPQQRLRELRSNLRLIERREARRRAD